jgi:hypothetical protein
VIVLVGAARKLLPSPQGLLDLPSAHPVEPAAVVTDRSIGHVHSADPGAGLGAKDRSASR